MTGKDKNRNIKLLLKFMAVFMLAGAASGIQSGAMENVIGFTLWSLLFLVLAIWYDKIFIPGGEKE